MCATSQMDVTVSEKKKILVASGFKGKAPFPTLCEMPVCFSSLMRLAKVMVPRLRYKHLPESK